MDELVSRQAVIDALRTCYDTETVTMDNGDEYINYDDAVGEIEQLPPSQPEISYIILETLHECGIYGEEATIKQIGTLKRLGIDDLLPPCIR